MKAESEHQNNSSSSVLPFCCQRLLQHCLTSTSSISWLLLFRPHMKAAHPILSICHNFTYYFFQIVSAQTFHLQLDWKDCRTSACSAHTRVLYIITYVLSLAVVKINNSAHLLEAEYLLIKYSHFHQTLECRQAELSLEARGDAALRSWVMIQVKTNTATPLG